MLIDQRRNQVSKALQTIKGIAREERQEIAALDLPIYDSLVIAHLRLAHHLLARDHAFDWKTREEAWHHWRAEMLEALEGSLRYRENDALVVTIGVCAVLFPVVHQGAWLMAYKTLNDVALAAQRVGYSSKRERAATHLRVKDIITRASIWLCLPSDLFADRDLTADQRAAISARGTEVTGLILDFPDAPTVIRWVNCVVPVRWQAAGESSLVIPAL